MKNTYPIKLGLLISLLIGSTFGSVSKSYAQSVQNWSKPVNISNSGAASNPSIVVDNNGVIDILWIDSFDGYKFSQSADGGLTWTSPTTVKFPFSISTKSSPPTLFSDSKGLIHIFWLNDNHDLSYAQTLASNINTPTAWRVTKLDAPVYDFDAHIDENGILHLGYVKNSAANTGAAGVYYLRSADSGTAWSTPTLLYESSYFRSLTADQARVRLAISDNADGNHVYAVWDDRPQKRIFMATAADNGVTWSPVQELVAPQSSLGFKTPYHADVDVLGNKVLVTWQVGDPGTQCTPYSWTSVDSGKTWNEPTRIFTDSTNCPDSSEFLSVDPAYSVMFFTVQGNLSLSAWNGQQWSNSESQTGPSSITNPLTFDTVLLGCVRTAVYQKNFYVVGCDQGKGGDVWFIGRSLDSLSSLFPHPSAWGGDVNVSTFDGVASYLTSVPDDAGNVHVFWMQSSGTSANPIEPSIMYARWNGKEWTSPISIFTNLSDPPGNLTVQFDSNHRLLLSWVNQRTGDLLFTWANSERANVSAEWMPPVVLPSSSPLTSSIDMLVDASHRIIIAYAIPLNEGRGVYIIQSTDLGENWSAPIRVFDAAAANWQMVDQPKLAVSEDGRLHIIFTQYTLVGGQQSVGLYYSQSADGGNTWTAPNGVSNQSVQSSEIVAYKNVLNLIWQEKNNSVSSTHYQKSSDSGVTWSSSTKIPSTSSEVSTPAVSLDSTGKIHILKVIQDDVVNLQEWGGADEQHLQLLETRQFGISNTVSLAKVESGISSQGAMYVLVQFEKKLDTEDKLETSILNIRRSLDLPQPAQPLISSVSTPASIALPTTTAVSQPTLTPISPVVNLSDTKSTKSKNIVGLVLIVLVTSLSLFLIVPRKRSSTGPTK